MFEVHGWAVVRSDTYEIDDKADAELLTALAKQIDLTGSYGLLYVLDDEDYQDGDYQNEFRVWRLVRGALEERSDPFLSPFIPTVEDPYDPARDQ